MFDQHVNLVAGIVSAFLSHNNVRPEDVPAILTDVHAVLVSIERGPGPIEVKPQPLMPWKKTIHREYLVSLEDGKHYQTLKRHLTTRGMTIADYRAKWDLPKDYPSTCAAYSQRRSSLAVGSGLGKKPAGSIVTKAPEKPKTEKKMRPHPKPKDRASRSQEKLEAA